MLMPVKKVFGGVGVKQSNKAFETDMSAVFAVAQAEGRRVCKKDVKALMLFYSTSELADPFFHLLFSILEFLVAVIDAAAQAQYPDAIDHQKVVICGFTSFRRLPEVVSVVVSRHINERRLYHRYKEGQIFCLDIAAGQYQLNILKALFIEIVPNIWLLTV
jgi:hypothetical protein